MKFLVVTFWPNYFGAAIVIIVCAAITGYAIIFLGATRKKDLSNDPTRKVLSVEEALNRLSSKGFITCVKEDLFVHRYSIANRIAWSAGFLAIALTSIVTVSFLNHENLLDVYKRGACKQIEGTVESVNIVLTGGFRQDKSWMESFWVNGHRFAYTENQLMVPGFQKLHMHGGPIKEGLNVRIWY